MTVNTKIIMDYVQIVQQLKNDCAEVCCNGSVVDIYQDACSGGVFRASKAAKRKG